MEDVEKDINIIYDVEGNLSFNCIKCKEIIKFPTKIKTFNDKEIEEMK